MGRLPLPHQIHRLKGATALGLLFIVTSAWADFEVYHKKGFAKVAEILEKETNEDGTLRIKAKKSNGDLVEFREVTEIVEVEKKTGKLDSGLVAPPPTSVPLPGQGRAQRPGGAVQDNAPPPSQQVDIDGVAENYRPDLNVFMANIKWIAMAIAGVAALVVAFFVISKATQ